MISLAIPGPRTLAITLWATSLAWLTRSPTPHSAAEHRIVIGVAVACTVIAAIDSRAQDLRETARLARAAERHHLKCRGRGGPDTNTLTEGDD